MLRRNIAQVLKDALADTPAVLLVGPRQAGKTTLARALEPGRAYFTFDEASALAAATADPQGFVAALSGPVVLDEIQKVPALLPALKSAIDRQRKPGRFLLTGSADVLTLPKVKESLAGRMEVATLWPLSQGEIAGHREGFLQAALAGKQPHPEGKEPDAIERILAGGFPESISRKRDERRAAFFDSYVTAVVVRDVRDVSAIEDPGSLRRLLQLAAARPAAVLNHTELSRTLGLPVSTLKRYLAILEQLFLLRELPAWSTNRGKRLARAPKLHPVDTGLAAALAGVDAQALDRDRVLLGGLLESFVLTELIKQSGFSASRASFFHLRAHGGPEVDIVAEDARGRLVGIEVKAGSTVGESDFRGLRHLAEVSREAFVQGIVLHLGTSAVPFGPRLHALPLAALWSPG